jgi:hypothetical protein
LNGGAPGPLTGRGISSIDPRRLVRDPMNNCVPVYPWNFVRTNTTFGVIHGSNSQVPPTILKSPGLEPDELDAVRQEGTEILPAANFQWNDGLN